MAQRTSVEPGVQEWFHYEMPLEFFQLFLDRSTMGYTCAYFPDSDATLDEAQRRKIELVVRKLDTQAGDRILEIGSGWGNLTLKNVELGAHVTGMTMNPTFSLPSLACDCGSEAVVFNVSPALPESNRLVPPYKVSAVISSLKNPFRYSCSSCTQCW